MALGKVCVICKGTFRSYGNNAEPVKKGYCCNECNLKYVIPARLTKVYLNKEGIK